MYREILTPAVKREYDERMRKAKARAKMLDELGREREMLERDEEFELTMKMAGK